MQQSPKLAAGPWPTFCATWKNGHEVYRIWGGRAEARLTDLYLATSGLDRALLTAATNEIDRQLQTDAHEVGESRAAIRRILLVAPLAVIFKASPDDRTVQVINIWRFNRRRNH